MVNPHNNKSIYIDLSDHSLRVQAGTQILFHCAIASARNGTGECYGSEQTPRGWHTIRAKIGAGKPVNSVFVARRHTGEIYSEQLAQEQPERDWILSRILWLNGLEPGFNRLGNVDTMRRYIYIHGCPDTVKMKQANSHGCIRMRNADIIELFDLVDTGTPVLISE